MGDTETLIRLLLDEYHLVTEWSDTSITLSLICGDQVWRKEVKHGELRQMAHNLRYSLLEYRTVLRRALDGDGALGQDSFEFNVRKEPSDAYQLSCKMTMADDVKVLLLSVTFNESGKGLVDILKALAELCERRRRDLTSLETQLNRAREERAEALRKYEEVVMEKREQQDSLLCKFLVLLNSKKSRIRELEDELSTENSHSRIVKSVSGKKASTRRDQISSSASSNVTDDEVEASGKAAKRGATSAQRQDSDDDLFDETPPKKVTLSRRRSQRRK